MVHLHSLLNKSLHHFKINEQLISKWVIIIVVLVTSFYLSPKIVLGGRNSLLFLFLMIGSGVALILLRYPHLGLTALIPAAMIVPFSIGTGSQTNLNAAVLLLGLLIGLWIMDMIVRQRKIQLVPSRPILPILALIFIAVLSFGFGQLPWFSIQPAPIRAQLGGVALFCLSAGAFLVVAHQIKEIRGLQWMTWLFISLGGLYVIGILIPFVGNYTYRLFQYGSTGSLFWTWLAALAFSQALLNQRLPTRWRMILFALVVGLFYTSFIKNRGWTSGWLPALIAVFVIYVISNQKKIPIIIMGIVVIAGLNLQTIYNLVMAGDNPYSLTTRLEAWKILGQIIMVNPIFGLGPANYYWYTPLFQIAGYYVPFNSHNNYVDIIAQTGLLGLACFLWFAWEVGNLGFKLRTMASEGFARAYVYGCLGGLAGTLVAAMLGDWVIPFVYNVGYDGFRSSMLAWVFLGGLVTLEQISIMSKKST